MSHTPVLLKEVLDLLDPKPGNFVIDGTVDGGGHARAILSRISPGGTLLGVDWDARMIANSKIQSSNSKVVLVHGNYADLPDILREQKLPKADFVSPKGDSIPPKADFVSPKGDSIPPKADFVSPKGDSIPPKADFVSPKADGLLLDLGFSSEQIDAEGRGMSFLRDEPLRMTYSDDQDPVSKILRELSERDLTKILREYGEERYAPRIAKAIKESLNKGSVETTGRLAEIIAEAVPRNYERGRIHPATRTFQALRIYANAELENLTKVLQALPGILNMGGRVAILTFHSLEDRIVKHTFRAMEKEGVLEVLTKKPVEASESEMQENPRSRSAKLRAALIKS
ncbi:MAG: 16S rRNA (cytosine(1402)-N(4))-methyltransferase RsmH [Candidatus Liptonbacteria bacterium]|nr:16S rRNA (cytosine(1402)-N(4))-methyltransferase RsmH [Candidatus Liptonbacteria bacterium]